MDPRRRPDRAAGDRSLAVLTVPGDAWLPVLATEIERVPASGSGLHGVTHWRAVGATGRWLTERTRGAELMVVLCFALLHDCARRDDGYDPDHGLRAARLVRRLPSDLLRLDARACELLEDACARHSEQVTSSHPTIACCFDADRLQLVRLGIAIDPRWLSTTAARLPDALEAADGYRDSPASWAQLAARPVHGA